MRAESVDRVISRRVWKVSEGLTWSGLPLKHYSQDRPSPDHFGSSEIESPLPAGRSALPAPSVASLCDPMRFLGSAN